MKRANKQIDTSIKIPNASIKKCSLNLERKKSTSQDIHLGHYKALLEADGLKYKNDEDPAEYI